MGAMSPVESRPRPPVQQEFCDKCGELMSLQSAGCGFERWECPGCQQVVGVDRDPVVGGRFQLWRGLPWRYSQRAFAP